MLSENQSREILREIFEARGLQIAEDFPFRERGVAFSIDGWDAAKRIGYEFMTEREHDHEDLNPDELGQIWQWNAEGSLHLLIIDETEVETADDLKAQAHAFLDELDRPKAPR